MSVRHTLIEPFLLEPIKPRRMRLSFQFYFFYKEGISLKINKGYKGGGKQYLKSLP